MYAELVDVLCCCEICCHPSKSSIILCVNGHTGCSRCRARFSDVCPFCREKLLSIPNRAVNEMNFQLTCILNRCTRFTVGESIEVSTDLFEKFPNAMMKSVPSADLFLECTIRDIDHPNQTYRVIPDFCSAPIDRYANIYDPSNEVDPKRLSTDEAYRKSAQAFLDQWTIDIPIRSDLVDLLKKSKSRERWRNTKFFDALSTVFLLRYDFDFKELEEGKVLWTAKDSHVLVGMEDSEGVRRIDWISLDAYYLIPPHLVPHILYLREFTFVETDPPQQHVHFEETSESENDSSSDGEDLEI